MLKRMAVVSRRQPDVAGGSGIPETKEAVRALLDGYSIETTPVIAAKMPAFDTLMPRGTAVYIAFLPGKDYRDVVATAARLAREGMQPVPHIAARSLAGRPALEDYVARLTGEAGIDRVLCIGGGVDRPVGDFDRTMQVLESGVLQRHGIRRIGVAGHPEGSPDIPAGEVRRALHEKQAFARAEGLDLYIATQFCFDPEAILRWDRGLREEGITLPVHIGVAGPAKLKSLIDYARMCGVGASLRVLTRQAGNLAQMASTSMPDRLLTALARYRQSDTRAGIERTHIYAFGGLKKTASWLTQMAAGRFTPTQDGFRFDGDF